MKKPFEIFSTLMMFVFGGLFLNACTGSEFTTTSNSTSSSVGSGTLSSKKSCKAPLTVSASPKTIEEAVSLINALPKPVTVACFIASLDRPLSATLTDNPFSGQPAVGYRSPRIFIIIGALTISVVPEGLGRDLVEFSYMVSETMSVKAELEFPVANILSPSAPYDRVRYNKGTSCGVCHGAEFRYSQVGFAEAFYSKAFQPQKFSIVGIDTLQDESAKCNAAIEPERCAIISAFLSNGVIRDYEFPSVIPFF